MTTTEPATLITDDDVHDIAEWLHPLWFESDHGRMQTWTTLLEQVRGALESRGPTMRDRWVTDALERLAAYADADDAFALSCADALMDRWGDHEGQAVRIHADPRSVVQTVLTALAGAYRRGQPT